MTSDQDLIIAIATAPGRGGIGVIRISGVKVPLFITSFFNRDLSPRHAHYLPFLDYDGSVIDEGIALFFMGPNSYTGEHVLELQGHGGPMVLKRLLNRCLNVGKELGLRLALPGEFTRRAFLNDRLDLAQAEAVADLIDASSEAAAKGAAASLSGVFSTQITILNKHIIELRMLVEATLDFPEEEIEFLEKYQAHDKLSFIMSRLQDILAQAKQGALLREGLQVVLAGQPNVGKSSLLNTLAGDDIAIVTDIAGTTRDRIIQEIHLNGIPLHIIDTAGLRDTHDTVEKIGIDRTWAAINNADIVLFIQDPTQNLQQQDAELRKKLPNSIPILDVVNKTDLITTPTPSTNENKLYISVKTGQGIAELKTRLLQFAGWNPSQESPYLARERHVQALLRAQEHLHIANEHASYNDTVLDLFAEELRLAQEALNQITGAFTSDDLLGVIFSSFCIGK